MMNSPHVPGQFDDEEKEAEAYHLYIEPVGQQGTVLYDMITPYKRRKIIQILKKTEYRSHVPSKVVGSVSSLRSSRSAQSVADTSSDTWSMQSLGAASSDADRVSRQSMDMQTGSAFGSEANLAAQDEQGFPIQQQVQYPQLPSTAPEPSDLPTPPFGRRGKETRQQEREQDIFTDMQTFQTTDVYQEQTLPAQQPGRTAEYPTEELSRHMEQDVGAEAPHSSTHMYSEGQGRHTPLYPTLHSQELTQEDIFDEPQGIESSQQEQHHTRERTDEEYDEAPEDDVFRAPLPPQSHDRPMSQSKRLTPPKKSYSSFRKGLTEKRHARQWESRPTGTIGEGVLHGHQQLDEVTDAERQRQYVILLLHFSLIYKCTFRTFQLLVYFCDLNMSQLCIDRIKMNDHCSFLKG